MSTHHGFIKEFPWIRVDAFDGDPEKVNPYSRRAPVFHLLTHAHTDHIVGLDSPHFAGRILCTPVTKTLLLNTVETGHRVVYEETDPASRTRKKKFANLSKREGNGNKKGKKPQDRIEEIQLNVPTFVGSPYGDVTITALDANHCPGSCMFLIEGVVNKRSSAVIVTGDIRAEPWWIEALERNPAVSKYVGRGPPAPAGKGKGRASEEGMWPTLDNIYLDTSAVLLNQELVGKKEAVASLIGHMQEYPPSTKFFLNSWTWGYEDMLKGVSQAFDTDTHLDWYKHRMYTSSAVAASDPHLSQLGTLSEHSRFHACERRWKCDHVWGEGEGCYAFDADDYELLMGPKKFKKAGTGDGEGNVVFVNPWEMPQWRWEEHRQELEETFAQARDAREVFVEGRGRKRKAGAGVELPNALIIPLARHSSLPELRQFVSIFRPKTLYPLTIADDSRHPCHDYRSLSALFGDFLAPGGAEQLQREANEYTLALVNSRARPRTEPFDSSTMSIGKEDVRFVVGGRMHPEAYSVNVEGGAAVADFVRKWTRMDGPAPAASLGKRTRIEQRDSVPSPSPRSASSTAMRGDTLQLADSSSSEASANVSQPQVSRAQKEIANSTLKASHRSSPVLLPSPALLPAPALPSPALPSRNLLLPSSSLLPSPVLLPPPSIHSRPLATKSGAGMTKSRPSTTSSILDTSRTKPSRRRLGTTPSITIFEDDASPSSSPPFLPLPAITKPPLKVSFGLTSSQESSLIIKSSAQPPPSPELFVPSSATSTSSAQAPRGISEGVKVVRPTLASREWRREVVARVLKANGGWIGPDGGIVPFPAGDPRRGVVSASPQSWRTVSASGSEGTSRAYAE